VARAPLSRTSIHLHAGCAHTRAASALQQPFGRSLVFGLAVTLVVAGGGHLGGAHMSPAAHWLYWVASIVGTVAGMWLYDALRATGGSAAPRDGKRRGSLDDASLATPRPTTSLLRALRAPSALAALPSGP
jgi:hypothetical protein